MNSPCFNCKYRSVGCHAVCKNFAEYRAKVDKLGKAQRKRTEVVNYCMAQRRQIAKKRNLPKGGPHR